MKPHPLIFYTFEGIYIYTFFCFGGFLLFLSRKRLDGCMYVDMFLLVSFLCLKCVPCISTRILFCYLPIPKVWIHAHDFVLSCAHNLHGTYSTIGWQHITIYPVPFVFLSFLQLGPAAEKKSRYLLSNLFHHFF